MKKLNFANPKESNVTFSATKFPDGQQQVTIERKSLFNGTTTDKTVTIQTRMNNFTDLELIVCAVASLRSLGVKEIHLYVPYFLGSRSDRKFEGGSNNYLKDVICPIINKLNFTSITILDPHSDVLEACLDNFEKITNITFVVDAFKHYYNGQTNSYMLLSPDAGASKKIYDVAKAINYLDEIVICGKHRDVKGAITETIVPYFDVTRDAVIIDDICDGGRTFIEIATVIKKRHEQYKREMKDADPLPGKIILIVTHGIFSKGFGELEKYFDKVICTNSYKEIHDLGILCGQHSTRSVGDLVKQFNIF